MLLTNIIEMSTKTEMKHETEPKTVREKMLKMAEEWEMREEEEKAAADVKRIEEFKRIYGLMEVPDGKPYFKVSKESIRIRFTFFPNDPVGKGIYDFLLSEGWPDENISIHSSCLLDNICTEVILKR